GDDLEEAMRKGAKKLEKLFQKKNGERFWVEITSVPITKNGAFKYYLASWVDITDRKQAEEALLESEGKLNAMLQSIGDHMSMMDKDLNIIWANKIAKEVFGNDIIGKKCYETYHQRKEPCEPYPCLTLKAFRDGKVHKHDT
ncbi:MAG: PAS domain-containing protein, partial [Proteobacteria bacterium]|nr:PAS domain-containing protein [Pseudomonadota bacterium]